MKRLITFKEQDGFYYGIFSGIGQHQNVYELPLINLISCFFKEKIYPNLTIVKSRRIDQVEDCRGIVVGELDALVLSRLEKTIYPIEIKARHSGNFTKKMKLQKEMLKIIIKWQFKISKKVEYNTFVPIWYFREDLSTEEAEHLRKKNILKITLPEIKRFLESRNFSNNDYLNNNIIRKMHEEILPDRGIHQFISDKIGPPQLRSISKLFTFKEYYNFLGMARTFTDSNGSLNKHRQFMHNRHSNYIDHR